MSHFISLCPFLESSIFFFLTMSVVFSRVPYNRNYSLCDCFRMASFTCQCAFHIHPRLFLA